MGALLDGYTANTEAVQELKGEVERLVEKVDKQEVEIKVIRNAK
jgi:ADP-dependent phosphofructokinase/glucokinase